MDPISEEAEDQPPRSCCSFLFGGSAPNASPREAPLDDMKNNDSGIANNKLSANSAPPVKRDSRPGMGARYNSVYLSARQDLEEADLKALKEFEDAVVNSMGGDESTYFDALEASSSDGIPSDLPYAPAMIPQTANHRESCVMADPSTLLQDLIEVDELTQPRVKIALAGYPGNLTESELVACQRLREELNKRKGDTGNDGKVYEEIIRVYKKVETEPYALCRFLRARQFHVDKVFEMMSECVEQWREAREYDFHPEPSAAIKAPVNVFLTQFPVINYGCAKSGAPISYVRTDGLSVEGMECLTDLEKLPNYAWHSSYHSFQNEVAKAQVKNPDLVRCEMIQVVDLRGLNSSTLNARTLETLKGVIAVNKCFPEVLNCMVILNAPRFFTFFWRVIKSMLDPRTASKIEMFSNEKDGINWLHERVDTSELLSDYGGTGASFEDVQNLSAAAECKRQIVKLISTSTRSFTKDTLEFSLDSGETVDLTMYTRSELGAKFELTMDGNAIGSADVKNPNATPGPYTVKIFEGVKGPGKVRLVPTPRSGGDHFIVAGAVN